jgi:hypothetical protein
MTTYAAPVDVTGASASGRNDVLIETNIPCIAFKETDAATDEKWWYIICTGEQWKLQVSNDNGNTVSDVIVADRTGTTFDQISFPQGEVSFGTPNHFAGIDMVVDGYMRLRDDAANRYRMDLAVVAGRVGLNCYDDTGAVYKRTMFEALSVAHKPNGGTTGGFSASNTTLDVNGVLAADTLEPWTAVTFASGWANLGGADQPCEYRRVGDMCEMRGVAHNTGTGGATIFTLPLAYRTSDDKLFSTQHFVASLNDGLEVASASGNVSWLGPSTPVYVYLDKIRYSIY